MKELSKWNQTKIFWEGFAIGVMVFAILMLSIPAFASQVRGESSLTTGKCLTIVGTNDAGITIGRRG